MISIQHPTLFSTLDFKGLCHFQKASPLSLKHSTVQEICAEYTPVLGDGRTTRKQDRGCPYPQEACIPAGTGAQTKRRCHGLRGAVTASVPSRRAGTKRAGKSLNGWPERN